MTAFQKCVPKKKENESERDRTRNTNGAPTILVHIWYKKHNFLKGIMQFKTSLIRLCSTTTVFFFYDVKWLEGLTATVDPFLPTPPVIITRPFLIAMKTNTIAAAYNGIVFMSRLIMGTFERSQLKIETLIEVMNREMCFKIRSYSSFHISMTIESQDGQRNTINLGNRSPDQI